MNEFDLLIDLHKHMQRQGPGSTYVTEKAIELTGLKAKRNLEIIDIGCRTGAQTPLPGQPSPWEDHCRGSLPGIHEYPLHPGRRKRPE